MAPARLLGALSGVSEADVPHLPSTVPAGHWAESGYVFKTGPLNSELSVAVSVSLRRR